MLEYSLITINAPKELLSALAFGISKYSQKIDRVAPLISEILSQVLDEFYRYLV
jgi:hypothetical protein